VSRWRTPPCQALRYAYAGGARLMPAGARDTTDDQGQYRLFGLPPGDYIVSATLRTGDVTDPGDEPRGIAPTYFPGTPNPPRRSACAWPWQQENATVSFGLIATRLVRVSGQVISATGGPPWGGVVVLMPATGGAAVPAFRGGGGGGGGRIEGTAPSGSPTSRPAAISFRRAPAAAPTASSRAWTSPSAQTTWRA
jgi:hypothetical protein